MSLPGSRLFVDFSDVLDNSKLPAERIVLLRRSVWKMLHFLQIGLDSDMNEAFFFETHYKNC